MKTEDEILRNHLNGLSKDTLIDLLMQIKFERDLMTDMCNKLSKESRFNNHEVACIIASLLGDKCACDYDGNDRWLPDYCDFANTCCPNPGGVACWEQYLKYVEVLGEDEL